MRKVIYVCEEPKEEKGIEFTHHLDGVQGWVTNDDLNFGKIVYLGNCNTDGDMFAAYDDNGNIWIFKGHLNNGTF